MKAAQQVDNESPNLCFLFHHPAVVKGIKFRFWPYPTPDGCDTIGEGDGTETDASSTSREEVDTISVHTLGAPQNFGAPSSVYTMCLSRRSGERVLLRPRRWQDRAGLPTVSSD